MKVAVVMAGLLGAWQTAIESIKNNVVDPNKADVFILTERRNYVHASGPVPHIWSIDLPLDGDEERLIGDCLGPNLKHFEWCEDNPRYAACLDEALNLLPINLSGAGHPEDYDQYDPTSRTMLRPVWYVDQFVKLKVLAEQISGYDVLLRYRIDQAADCPVIVDCMPSMAWVGMDNLFFGPEQSFKQVCSEMAMGIGGYRPLGSCGGHGLTSDAQFGGCLRFPRTVSYGFGWRAYRRDGICSIPDFIRSESERFHRGLEFDQYYRFTKMYTPPSAIYDMPGMGTLWAYYLHDGRQRRAVTRSAGSGGIA
jgi:hypothetical protein